MAGVDELVGQVREAIDVDDRMQDSSWPPVGVLDATDDRGRVPEKQRDRVCRTPIDVLQHRHNRPTDASRDTSEAVGFEVGAPCVAHWAVAHGDVRSVEAPSRSSGTEVGIGDQQLGAAHPTPRPRRKDGRGVGHPGVGDAGKAVGPEVANPDVAEKRAGNDRITERRDDLVDAERVGDTGGDLVRPGRADEPFVGEHAHRQVIDR